jgi:hypothetical protein
MKNVSRQINTLAAADALDLARLFWDKEATVILPYDHGDLAV